MKKKYKWIILVLVLIGAGVGIWFWKFKKENTTIVLETVHAQYGTISNSVTATGTVQPVDTVAVGTQVSGTILKVYVDFNSPVRKGQLLAQLDKSVLLAQTEQINANLQSARANISYQKSNYDRQKELYDAGAISKAELETALYQYRAATQNVNAIAAQLSSAQKNLSYSNIYSPIDGIIMSRNVSEGQTVAASLSTPTLFSIAKDLVKMQVQASVDEADIGNVETGQRVDFTVDAFPADTFSGIVKEIRLRPSVAANVVTYTTIIDAQNSALKLKPGMTASITIYTKEIKNVLLVPAKATAFQPDSVLAKNFVINRDSPGMMKGGTTDSSSKGKPGYVWVIKYNNISRQSIMTGIDDETQIQVLAGLSPDDEIVTGYKQSKTTNKTTKKSPFMPARTGGGNRR